MFCTNSQPLNCMDRAQNEGMSPEVVQAIYRILEVSANPPESDPFDGLSDGFSAIRVLNDFFPNGMPRSFQIEWKRLIVLQKHHWKD